MQGRSHPFVSGLVDGSIYVCCLRRNAHEARLLGGSGGMPPRKILNFMLSEVVSAAFWGKNSYEHRAYNVHAHERNLHAHTRRNARVIFCDLF